MTRSNRGRMKARPGANLVRYGRGHEVHIAGKGGGTLCDKRASAVRSAGSSSISCWRCLKLASMNIGNIKAKSKPANKRLGKRVALKVVPGGQAGLTHGALTPKSVPAKEALAAKNNPHKRKRKRSRRSIAKKTSIASMFRRM